MIFACVGMLGCAGPGSEPIAGDRYQDVFITPFEMRTGVRSQDAIEGPQTERVRVGVPPSVPDFESELSRWDGALRLVRWPSLQFVDGAWHHEVDESGMHAFAFVPASGEYEDGWYAVQIDFAAIGGGRGTLPGLNLPVVEGWTTSLFRVGSQPLVRILGTIASDRGGATPSQLEILTSEAIPVRAEDGDEEFLEVTANGEVLSCAQDRTGAQDFPDLFAHATLLCPRVAEGAQVELRFRPDYFTARVWDYRAQTPPAWSFVAGQSADRERPSEDLFLIDPTASP